MKYTENTGIRSYVLIGTAIVILLALIEVIRPVSAEESITARCYRDGRSLGTIEIYENMNAASACNSLYYDCKGKCIACYHDFDYVDYVCVDTSGRTFLR